MAVSPVRYLASLVGMVTAAVVCGVRSTSVVRVWFSDGVVPEDVAERCGRKNIKKLDALSRFVHILITGPGGSVRKTK